MAKLTPGRIEELHNLSYLRSIEPSEFMELLGHIDALTQENAELHARIAGYEQAAQERKRRKNLGRKVTRAEYP